ncbi:MAG: TonB family protein [Parvularcula sp.]|jgi:TonB family protein|nr:TonB family protein [Parvularcula sp.]
MGQADMQSGADVVALAEERQRRSEQADASLSTAGGMLRAAREALGIDLPTLSERTNIKEANLAAIEAMAIDRLPSQPYTMGFVRAYAREVNLPEDALMERFRQQAGYSVRDRAPGITQPKAAATAQGGKELSVLALLAILAFVLWCAWQLLVSTAPEEAGSASRFSYSAEDTAEARPLDPTLQTPAAPVLQGNAPATEQPQDSVGEVAPAPEGGDAPIAATPLVTEEPVAISPEDTATDTTAPAAAEAAVEPTVPVELRRLVAVEPVYPPLCEAQAQPLETVTVSFTVSARGRVVNPRVASSTNTCFNGAALAALTRWRYDPATVTEANARQTSRLTFERPY